MKATNAATTLHPLYVLAAASLGGAVGALLFMWNYRPPSLPDFPDMAVPNFSIWLFLIVIYSALLAIFLVPMWVLFIRLFKRHWTEVGRENAIVSVRLLILTAVILGFIVVVTRMIDVFQVPTYQEILDPTHSIRMGVLYLFTFLVILPGMMGILILFLLAEHIHRQIKPGLKEAEYFKMAGELLSLRGLLQNFLLVSGTILSLVSINTAGLRATVIAAKPSIEPSFPITYVIVYGLFYTIILILIYAPVHLELAEVGRGIRDQLCPIENLTLENMDEVIPRRKTLEELLQTNIGLGQNLKSSIATFSPLVTTLILTLLGTRVNI